MSFDYDKRFVYATEDEAVAAISRQSDRINLVLAWLEAHGAPKGHVILTQCCPFPSTAEPMKCMNYLRWTGRDEDDKETECIGNLFTALSNPFVALADLSYRFGSADPEPHNVWRRKPAQAIIMERWIEPVPFVELPPVPQPFGPHPDFYDDECMLSNSSDQFILGAHWTKQDGSLWEKESAMRGFVRYFRWREISTV